MVIPTPQPITPPAAPHQRQSLTPALKALLPPPLAFTINSDSRYTTCNPSPRPSIELLTPANHSAKYFSQTSSRCLKSVIFCLPSERHCISDITAFLLPTFTANTAHSCHLPLLPNSATTLLPQPANSCYSDAYPPPVTCTHSCQPIRNSTAVATHSRQLPQPISYPPNSCTAAKPTAASLRSVFPPDQAPYGQQSQPSPQDSIPLAKLSSASFSRKHRLQPAPPTMRPYGLQPRTHTIWPALPS